MSKLMKMLGVSPAAEGPFIQSTWELVVCLLAALVLAGIMMGIYRLCHDSLTYNAKFNVTLMMLALVSTLLLALIQNNPLFSLGALGALSICRIRINTRDPRDLGFVFWSLMIGISSALGAFVVGLIGTVLLSGIMLLLGGCRRKKNVLTVVVRGRKDKIQQVQAAFQSVRGGRLQSQNVFPDSFEMVYDLDVPPEEEANLLRIFNDMEGIEGVNVLAPETQVA